jgi:3-oxoacyl-(acyl-carrier-protein) synthase
VFVCGSGAVSPAGWGVASLTRALSQSEPLPIKELLRPGLARPLRVRQVAPPLARPAFMTHVRLRRASAIAQHAVAVALEALGEDAARFNNNSSALGIVLCVMSGCVNYSRRFYDEALKDPATASPLVFPETVLNAPASHLGALLGTTAINYTLVGDPGTFLQGIALAADWLLSERVEGCVVIGAEEMDWLTADAFRLFDRAVIVADGAGALYLRREPRRNTTVQLAAITNPHLFSEKQTRAQAASAMRHELGEIKSDELLCDGLQGLPRTDAAEKRAWQDWGGPRVSPKIFLGEGLMAAAAWQCVAAIDALNQNRYSGAVVSVVGCNQQAIAARFTKTS